MTTLTFLLYRSAGLVEVRVTVPKDVLSERELEPGECTVEPEGLSHVLQEAALDALELMRPVAAVVAKRPWRVVPIRLPPWAPDMRTTDRQHALWCTAQAWSDSNSSGTSRTTPPGAATPRRTERRRPRHGDERQATDAWRVVR